MYKYIAGLGEVWVDSVPPPKDTTNPLWLKLPETINEGFQLLIWIDTGTNAGKWMQVVGGKGDTGPSGIVMQNEAPTDPNVLVWVDPDEAPGTIVEVKNELGEDPANPISQKAVTDEFERLRNYIDEKTEQQSLYQLWLNAGNSGTITDFFNSLKGEPGDPGLSAYQIAQANGYTGTEEEWLILLQN